MQASATFPGRECWRTRPQGPSTILLDRIAEGLGRNKESPRRRAPKQLKSSKQEEKALRNRTPPAPNRLSKRLLKSWFRFPPAPTCPNKNHRCENRTDQIRRQEKKMESSHDLSFTPQLLPQVPGRDSVLYFAEGFVEQPDGFVDVGLRRIEHRRKAEDVAVESTLANEQAVLAGAL